ncbi:MAG: hypothetical protein V7719_06265 [Psychroserpens sp.]|uniref:hypothetical protein n=1 Tax=Psychroserpens sp. TaxID=2020870 RepID=UPI003003A38A
MYPPLMEMTATSLLIGLSNCKYEFEYYKVNDAKFEDKIGIKYIIEVKEGKGDTIRCATFGRDNKVIMSVLKIKD